MTTVTQMESVPCLGEGSRTSQTFLNPKSRHLCVNVSMETSGETSGICLGLVHMYNHENTPKHLANTQLSA